MGPNDSASYANVHLIVIILWQVGLPPLLASLPEMTHAVDMANALLPDHMALGLRTQLAKLDCCALFNEIREQTRVAHGPELSVVRTTDFVWPQCTHPILSQQVAPTLGPGMWPHAA